MRTFDEILKLQELTQIKKPKILYHGGNLKNNKLEPNVSNYGEGNTYFSPDKEFSLGYSKGGYLYTFLAKDLILFDPVLKDQFLKMKKWYQDNNIGIHDLIYEEGVGGALSWDDDDEEIFWDLNDDDAWEYIYKNFLNVEPNYHIFDDNTFYEYIDSIGADGHIENEKGVRNNICIYPNSFRKLKLLKKESIP